MPQKTWVIGEEVLATDFNTYVQQQVVARFATIAARDAGWPAATAGDGALSTTLDLDRVWRSDGTTWKLLGGWQSTATGSTGAALVAGTQLVTGNVTLPAGVGTAILIAQIGINVSASCNAAADIEVVTSLVVANASFLSATSGEFNATMIGLTPLTAAAQTARARVTLNTGGGSMRQLNTRIVAFGFEM